MISDLALGVGHFRGSPFNRGFSGGRKLGDHFGERSYHAHLLTRW
jgi:hypothetical protein